MLYLLHQNTSLQSSASSRQLFCALDTHFLLVTGRWDRAGPKDPGCNYARVPTWPHLGETREPVLGLNLSIHYFITQNYQQCAFTTSIMESDINDGTRSEAWWRRPQADLIWHLRETWEPVLGLHLSVPNSLQTAHSHLSVHPCNFPHLSTLFRNVECLVAPQRYLIWTEHLLDVSLHETCIFLNRTYLNN